MLHRERLGDFRGDDFELQFERIEFDKRQFPILGQRFHDQIFAQNFRLVCGDVQAHGSDHVHDRHVVAPGSAGSAAIFRVLRQFRLQQAAMFFALREDFFHLIFIEQVFFLQHGADKFGIK